MATSAVSADADAGAGKAASDADDETNADVARSFALPLSAVAAVGLLWVLRPLLFGTSISGVSSSPSSSAAAAVTADAVVPTRTHALALGRFAGRIDGAQDAYDLRKANKIAEALKDAAAYFMTSRPMTTGDVDALVAAVLQADGGGASVAGRISTPTSSSAVVIAAVSAAVTMLCVNETGALTALREKVFGVSNGSSSVMALVVYAAALGQAAVAAVASAARPPRFSPTAVVAAVCSTLTFGAGLVISSKSSGDEPKSSSSKKKRRWWAAAPLLLAGWIVPLFLLL